MGAGDPHSAYAAECGACSVANNAITFRVRAESRKQSMTLVEYSVGLGGPSEDEADMQGCDSRLLSVPATFSITESSSFLSPPGKNSKVQ